MFRWGKRRPTTEREFGVSLQIQRLDSIPVTNTVMFVRWDVLNHSLAVPSTGRTFSRPVEPNNIVRWDSVFDFDLRIPSEPSDATLLEPCILRLSIRSERRKKAGYDEQGVVEIDLAEIAGMGRVSRSCLMHNSRLNSLLKVQLKVHLKRGDPIFRRPAATQSVPTAQPALHGTANARKSDSVSSASSSVRGALDGHSALDSCQFPSGPSAPALRPDATAPSKSQPNVLASSGDLFHALPVYQGRTLPASRSLEPAPIRSSPAGPPIALPSALSPWQPSSEPSPTLQRRHTPLEMKGTRSGLEISGLGSGCFFHPPEASSSGDSGASHQSLVAPVAKPVTTTGLPTGSNGSTGSLRDASPMGRYFPTPLSTTIDAAQSDATVRTPPRTSGKPGSDSGALPLSPRSPSAGVQAAAVLDYLVPEPAQGAIYENMRRSRIRDQEPIYVIESRIDAQSAVEQLLQREHEASAGALKRRTAALDLRKSADFG